MDELSVVKPVQEQQGKNKNNSVTPSTKPRSYSQHEQKSSNNQVITVGNFEIGQTIGRGTFGKVKLGIHKITSEKVAVKILEKDKLIDSSDKKRLQREISILRKIRHPNIIQLYEIIETPRQLYLFMEYAPNGELFDYIVKRKRLSERQASKFLQQIINGIEYISKLGVVHRDLKPENLLLDHNFNIKIVDFGLSNTYKQGQKLSTACGSPCYAAPEMIAGKPYNGLYTDIWSSGVILYAMLCGFLPFEDQNTSNLYKKIMNQDPNIPNFLSSNSKGIINGILAKDPEKRFSIQNIRMHTFCKEREPVLQGIIVGQDDIPIDQNILKQLEKYSINIEQAEEMIKKNKHNNITSVYSLLLLKSIREGIKQNFDVQQNTKDKSDLNKLSQSQNKPKISSLNNDVQKNIQALQNFSIITPSQVSTQPKAVSQPSTDTQPLSLKLNLKIIEKKENEKEKEKEKENIDIKALQPIKNINYPQKVQSNEFKSSDKPKEIPIQNELSQNQKQTIELSKQSPDKIKQSLDNQIVISSKKKQMEINKENDQKKLEDTKAIEDKYKKEDLKNSKIKTIEQQDISSQKENFKPEETVQSFTKESNNDKKQNSTYYEPFMSEKNENQKSNINQQNKRILQDKTNLNGYMMQSTYSKKQNNYVDINNTSSSNTTSVPNQSKKHSIIRISNLNNSVINDTKETQKYKVNASFQQANASKYSVGEEDDKLMMISSIQTQNAFYKNGKRQISKRTEIDNALNITQESPKIKTDHANITQFLQKNSQFPTNLLGIKNSNPNNSSLNSFNKTRYFSVQRHNSKLNSNAPQGEDKKGFRIGSHSIHIQGNTSQYNSRNNNDSGLNISICNKPVTQIGSKRMSINQIKQIPLQEKLMNIHMQCNIPFQNKRTRTKTMSSMHDTSYNNKNNSFNLGNLNKENNKQNNGSKQEIKFLNNIETLNYGSVNYNINNYSLESEGEKGELQNYQSFQSKNLNKNSKVDKVISQSLRIQRMRTDENDKRVFINNKNNNSIILNYLNESNVQNVNKNQYSTSRIKKPDSNNVDNIRNLPLQIQIKSLTNNINSSN